MYDIVVVGAGPAGSTCARQLAKAGVKTALIEKMPMPRDKLCGGGITPKVLRILDFTLEPELLERTCYSARIFVDGQSKSFVHSSPLAYMTSRYNFDYFLARKAEDAGAELIPNSPVERIGIDEGGATIRCRSRELKAKLVVGADGAGGMVGRQAGLKVSWEPAEVALALETDYLVGSDKVEAFMGDQKGFDLYFGVAPAGYGWIFPKKDFLTVGVGCRLNKLSDAQRLFQDFVRKLALNGGKPRSERPQAHLIPVGGYTRVRSYSDRVILTGDSSAFAEPLLGEGIYFAIYGGKIAAEAAIDALGNDRFDAHFLSRYEKAWRAAFGLDFDVAYQVARFAYLENFEMDRMVRFFFKEKAVQDCMIGLMTGDVTYREAQRRLFVPYMMYRVSKWLRLPFYP